jgi:hypothetical protein
MLHSPASIVDHHTLASGFQLPASDFLLRVPYTEA